MHVAKVEYSEAVKKRWQLLEHNVVALDENAFCIPPRAPIKTRQLQGVSNDRMDRIPISRVPRSSSRSPIKRPSAEGSISSRCAALPKCRSSAAATKHRY